MKEGERMKAIPRGSSEVNFTNEKNEQIKGINLYITYTANNVKGEITDKIFLNAKSGITLPKNLVLGKPCDLFFDRKGKIESIIVAE